MKTREEIERVYDILVDRAQDEFDGRLADIREQRDAALAELDDPMLRLITAAKKAQTVCKSHQDEMGVFWHYPNSAPVNCWRCEAYVELRNAIDYAEQRRAQG